MAAIAALRLADYTPSAEINITPLIDVMLALMLIFMLTAPVLTQRIPMPLASSPNNAHEQRSLELDIDRNGHVSRAGYALSPLEVQAELLSFASKGGAMSLQLHPDANTSHQDVLGMIALANNSGIGNIALEMPAR